MDINVEKFIKDYKRMCDSYTDCNECELKELMHDCRNINNLDEVVPVVLEWAETHPAKTYLMDFKEKFPNCKLVDVVTCFCLKVYYGENAGLHPRDCKNCENCWNREMKE